MRAIFLDRDGIINIDKGYVYRIDDFEFCDGIFDICRHFNTLGYALIVVTNQSGIGRGYYSENDFNKVTHWMLESFRRNQVHITAVYHCPHRPDQECSCRKPRPGMLLQAAKEHRINLSKSWLIGDKKSDIEAAIAAGVGNTILIDHSGERDDRKNKIDHILGSVKAAKDIIVS